MNKETEKKAAPDWDSLRNQFPVARDFIYFNHAAIAPLPLRVTEQIASCAQKYCHYGIVGNREFLEIVEKTRELAARLVHAQASEIAFVKNTTQGILLAANGIKWEKGDNVVLPDKEFPANVFPWLNLTEKGVEVRFVPLRNGGFTVEDIRRLVDKRTRAVSVSAVSFVNGFRCDLPGIGRLCQEKDIFFIVDAIQALGAVDLNVKDCQVDLLSADGHKWLLGPQGIGVAYLSRKALDTLAVSNMGWMSMSDESNHLRYDIRLKPTAARFEEGTLNILGIVGLKASLEMLLDIGVPLIQARILALTDRLISGLAQRGFQVQSSMEKEERSGILSFTHPALAAGDICQQLHEANVVCALRDGAVRISPHFYNNQEDVDRFLTALG